MFFSAFFRSTCLRELLFHRLQRSTKLNIHINETLSLKLLPSAGESLVKVIHMPIDDYTSIFQQITLKASFN